MSTRAISVVLLAIVCGGSAAFGVNRLRQASGGAGPETVPIVVTKATIQRGQMLTRADAELRPWPKGTLPEGAVKDIEDAVDRAAVIPILPGEPLVAAKLAAKDAGRGLAALIPKGLRAYTIQTHRLPTSVAGFLLPGNRVDVLLTLRGEHNDGSGGGSTTTLLQSVEILAVDQRLDAPAENHVNPKDMGSVTLLVTPDQAAKLDLGQNLGQLSLALRNLDDQAEVRPKQATLSDIRFHQEKPWAASLLEAWMKKPPETSKKEPAKKEPPPKHLEIVTLRGSEQGRVFIQTNR